MSRNKYQGWSNYETWLVSLWLDNEQCSHEHWRHRAVELGEEAATHRNVREGIWTVSEAQRFSLADELKEEISDGSPLEEPSMYCDLLAAALDEVNWSEIAGELIHSASGSTRSERE